MTTIDERLERARDDYRSLEIPPLPYEARGSARRQIHTRVLAAAAVALVLVGSAVLALTLGLGGDDTETLRVPAPAATSDTARTDPTPGDIEVTLDPPGPYTDGQPVTLGVDPGLGVDLWNGLPLCVTTSVADRPVETCESVASDSVSGDRVTVEVRRLGISADGARDCADPAVDCRFVLRTGDGRELRSARLTFTGPEPTEVAGLRATEVAPGRFALEPTGLVADPSWEDYRRRFPIEAAGNGPFWVSVCASGGPREKAPDPFDEDRDLWGEVSLGVGEVCDSRGAPATLDPDRPNDRFEIDVPRLLYGYGGWSDCSVAQCYVVITTNIVVQADGQSSMWDSRRTASVALPRQADWPSPIRPSLVVLTDGPHHAGDEIEIEVSGLTEGDRRLIGTCDVGEPWGCGYSMVSVGNGRHRFELPDRVELCAPRSCYLELDAGGEGLAPLATAPLDTP